jgi:hypothetical protein
VSDAPGFWWHGTRLRLAVTTLLAAAAGAAFGTALAPDGPDPRRDDGPPRVGLMSGVARLPLPAGWEPLRRRSSLPGLDGATAVRGVHSAVALDIRAPEDSSLLPADVVAASAGDLPAPRLRQLKGGRRAWRYEIPGSRPSTRLVALALPTSGGVVTIACQADAASIGRAGEECEGAMGGLRLDRAAELTPAPETAVRIVLPATVARLNRQRRSGRRALAATRSPHGRSEAARRLARAYVTFADRLRPLAAGEARRLMVAGAELAHAHRALAIASRRRDARSAERAGKAIETGERRLAPLLAAVSRRGTQPTARSAG